MLKKIADFLDRIYYKTHINMVEL